MKNLSRENIHPDIFDLYDDYAHNKLDRRQFIERLSIYAVGGLTVSSILDFILPNYAASTTIAADDQRLISQYVTYQSPKGGGEIRGLLSSYNGHQEKVPGVVVVHENRGLNPYVEDVVRRVAIEGFIAIGPDALWPLGGYPGDDDEGRKMQRWRDKEEMIEDFIAAFDYLKNHEMCSGKIGVVGFCFGGWISNLMATRLPDLGAAVPFYGGQPSAEETAKIKAPLLLHYAEHDERVNAGWPDYQAELIKSKVDYTAHFYKNAKHGFHNNSTPRYDEAAAQLAWDRTITFFQEKLK